jgi:NADH:ubiquinone oxidoreductase subunit C
MLMAGKKDKKIYYLDLREVYYYHRRRAEIQFREDVPAASKPYFVDLEQLYRQEWRAKVAWRWVTWQHPDAADMEACRSLEELEQKLKEQAEKDAAEDLPLGGQPKRFTGSYPELPALGWLLKGISLIVQSRAYTAVYLDKKTITPIIYILMKHIPYHYYGFLDGWACHYPERSQMPFQVNYLVTNLFRQSRLCLRYTLHMDETGLVNMDSLVPFFPGGNWVEREMWDLFGIFFSGHPGLRRILTDYGFEGFPLRKDFPVNGYYDLKYNYIKGGLGYQPIKMTQEFRTFNFKSPWI